jgi:hypothetical protein
MGMVNPMRAPHDPIAAWPIVVRTAAVAAVVVAALAGALHRFAGVDAEALVAMSAVVALLIGLRLPAASPAFLQPVADDTVTDLDAAV